MTRPLPADWADRRRAVLERDPICRAGGCGRLSQHVDHIVPRYLGGSDEPDNLQGLCHKHHGRKTMSERHDPFSHLGAEP